MAKLESGGVRTRTGQPFMAPQTIKEMVSGTPGKPQSLKGVFFGPPKTKKTTAACSGGRTLLINFDPEGYSSGTLVGRTDIDIIEPQDYGETSNVVAQVVRGGAAEYDFIVVDSVTFMFQRFGGRLINDTYMAGSDIRRAYGQAGAMAGQIINDLAFVPKTNVIFVAHLQKEFDEGSGVKLDQDLGEHEVTLAVTPMVWRILGPAVGFIGRTFKEDTFNVDTGNTETQFFVSYNDGSRSPAGSRYDMAGKYEITPTFLADLAIELL